MKFTLDDWLIKNSSESIVNPLSDRRTEMAPYVGLLETCCTKGIAFSINPRFDVADKLGEVGIKSIVQNVMDKQKAMYCLFPEYNTEVGHHLHYHGAIIVRTYDQLQKIRRAIVRQIGRVETDNVINVNNWAKYCVKSYAYYVNPDGEQVSNIVLTFNKAHVIKPKYLTLHK